MAKLTWNAILDTPSTPPDPNSPTMQAAQKARSGLRSLQRGVETVGSEIGQGVSGIYHALAGHADEVHPVNGGKK